MEKLNPCQKCRHTDPIVLAAKDSDDRIYYIFVACRNKCGNKAPHRSSKKLAISIWNYYNPVIELAHA